MFNFEKIYFGDKLNFEDLFLLFSAKTYRLFCC
jgi:hypothetical protein